MFTIRKSAFLVSLVLPALVAGCGGGGGSDTSTPAGSSSSSSGAGPSTSSSSSSSGGAAGGSSSSASSSSSGSSSGGSGNCDALSQRVRSTAIAVSAASKNDEYTPTIIAPNADGSALLAWRDTSGSIIKLAKLNSADTLQSYLPDIAGLEVHDVLNDAKGSVLAVLANDPDIYSPKYCYGATSSDKNVCGKMDLVGIDASGNSRFRTTLTKKGNADSVGAQFIWWYGHTARIATDGNRYGVYYRSAMSTTSATTAGEVDIHAGDTFKFVSSAGTLENGGWDWGCSHSWSVRLAYNGSWGAACHGDAYPNAMKLARLSSSTAAASNLSWLSDTDPAKRALGGLVPISGTGFWMNYIQTSNNTLVLKLAKLANNGTSLSADQAITSATGLDAAYPFRPYMAALGSDKLLLGWKAGGKVVIATANASTGEILEGPHTTSTSASNFQEFIPAPNGDVVWAHSTGGKTITVNRVAACKL